MIVWPNRIVVPILPEAVTGPLDHLYLRFGPRPLLLNLLYRKRGREAVADSYSWTASKTDLGALPAQAYIIVGANRCVGESLRSC
jgi:hypothetical protein